MSVRPKRDKGDTGNDGKSDIVTFKIERHGEEPVIKRYQKARFLGKGGFAQCFEFID